MVVYLPSKPLTYNQTYYVNVASGAIKSSSGAAFVVTGSTAWRFTTAAAAPTNKAAVGVALDGSAPFCSLQGALDFVPTNNTAAVTISIANGTYHEIVYFKSKSNVSIQGASQSGTILEGTNNNNLNPSTKGRALIGGDGTNGLTVNNLTIHNLTPQGGSQAEALRLERLRQVRRHQRHHHQPAGHAALERPDLRQERSHRRERRLRLGNRRRLLRHVRDPNHRALGAHRAGAQSRRPPTATSSSTASSPPTRA